MLDTDRDVFDAAHLLTGKKLWPLCLFVYVSVFFFEFMSGGFPPLAKMCERRYST